MPSFSTKSRSKASQRVARKAHYQSISYERRIELISLVIDKEVSIYQASRILGINNATAKVIVKKYRTHQYIFKRKNQKMPSNPISTSPVEELQQQPTAQMENSFQVDEYPNCMYPSLYPYAYPTFYVYPSIF